MISLHFKVSIAPDVSDDHNFEDQISVRLRKVGGLAKSPGMVNPLLRCRTKEARLILQWAM